MAREMNGRRRSDAAFSLVEVCLALGVVSFSLLSLIGLLPTGLGSLRESMDQTVRAQIVQKIAAELVMTDVNALGATTMNFDQEGQLLEDNQPSAVPYYSVELKKEYPSLPGLTNDQDIEAFQSHLSRIRIGISRSNIPSSPVVWYAIQVAVH